MSDSERPWLQPADAVSQRRHAPATLRNREPIAAILKTVLPPSGLVLEVASGSGEHAAYFAEQFPMLDWQPSDPDPAGLMSIARWREDVGLPNLRAPVRIDAMATDWPVARADAMLCCNMIHISPWEATLGLFAGAARLLASGAPLILYGPYLRDDVETAPSNLAFDADLKRRNPAWGIRRLEDVRACALERGFTLGTMVEMPANNLILTFLRR